MKQHIVIDARYLNKPGTGIHTYLIGLLKSLQNDAHKITLLVDEDVKKIEAIEKANIVVLKSGSRISWEQFHVPRFLQRVQPSVFIAPANFGLPLFFRKQNTKFALIIHDYIPLHFPFTYLLRRPAYLCSFILSVPISIYRADLIIANSNFTANETLKIFHKKALNAYMPIHYNDIRSKKAKPHTYENYFLYNSGPDPRKKITTLIEGFNDFNKKNPDYKLLIMGKGYDRYKSYATNKHYKNVIFIGYVSDAEKNVYLQNANGVITASKMEGFGLPLIEAFCAGVPVLCGRNSALQEVAGKAAYYIERLDSDGVSKALTGFVGLPIATKTQLIEEGYERIKIFNDFNSGLVINQAVNNLLED